MPNPEISEVFGRRFLRIPTDWAQAHGLERTLPVAAELGSTRIYELPVRCSEGESDHLPALQLMLGDLAPALHSAYPFIDTPDEEESSETEDDIAASLIREHVESVSEVLLPGRTSVRYPRSDELHLVPYAAFQDVIWEENQDQPPMRLIVHIADSCSRLVGDLCSRPRELLRREHEKQPLDRVQQIDHTSLRWLVRQPGRSIAEKSGPKQQILGVVRRKSVDTLENRVLKDFLIRSQRSARLYCRKHSAWKNKNSTRFQLVQRFQSITYRLLRYSAIGALPRLSGPPTANYVLQFDTRYGQLWKWYERLRRQQQEAQDSMRWQHRVWAELTRIAVMRTLDQVLPEQHLSGEVVVRSTQKHGNYLSSLSSYRSWICNTHSEALVVEAIVPPAISDEAGFDARHAVTLPDLVLRMRQPFGGTRAHSHLVCWSCFGRYGRHGDSTRNIGRWDDPDGPLLRHTNLVIAADPERQLDIQRAKQHYVHTAVCTRSTTELFPQIRAVLSEWIHEATG